ncbi:NAD-glutamate dehydrogenase [Nocardia sp. NPDC057668]|uniref:NAD-glutamate dehydrogenase n=1 Tax=Nocardia sp. NPDC057668 TaxID=3346202 RepID=UPI00366B446A
MAISRSPAATHLPAGDLTAVEAAYFRWIKHGGNERRDHERAASILGHHLELGRTRRAGTAVVHTYVPGDGSGIEPAIQIVTDDMPLLVDTVTAAVRRLGVEITDVLHPILDAHRDVDGTLNALLAPGSAAPVTAVKESWIHLQLGAVADTDVLHRLQQAIPNILTDLRHILDHTPAMNAALDHAAKALEHEATDRASLDAAQLLRWLADGRFTLLGAACTGTPDSVNGRSDTHFGLLSELTHHAVDLSHVATAPDLSLHLATASVDSWLSASGELFVVTVGVKPIVRSDPAARRWIFLGTLNSTALHENILDIPVVSDRALQVIQNAGFALNSFNGQAMLEVMQSYPRAELFSTSVSQLLHVASSVIGTDLRRQVSIFVRHQADTGAVYCLVHLPRDRYSSIARERMQKILRIWFGSDRIGYSARATESDLAVVHFRIHRPRVHALEPLTDEEHRRLETELFEATRTWVDRFEVAAGAAGLPRTLVREYLSGFPPAYQQDHAPNRAVDDLLRLHSLPDGDIDTAMQIRLDDQTWRFTLYNAGEHVSLSRVLPVLHSMGVEVLDERPYQIRSAAGHSRWVYDFGLRPAAADPAHPAHAATSGGLEALTATFTAAFTAAWTGRIEIDDLNSLVTRAQLDWPRIAVLRAYAKYLRQIGFPYSFRSITRVLLTHPLLACQLVDLFYTMFEPHHDTRDAATSGSLRKLTSMIDEVTEMDADRVLRTYLTLITATLRTNHFRHPRTDPASDQLALKFDARSIEALPPPRPRFEIFVYSPRVEGVHLRFGEVARGGIRWSDRLGDFRTEILGLVKAQAVKNSVIVPVGAKGGFVLKNASAPGVDRHVIQSEARECYRRFITAMLDVTDSIDHSTRAVIAPPRVVRRDGDDPYLVVAADKGTAAFSDLANSIAEEHRFWMGDAFASGGSVGYDHKAIGITARGAWESVRRHFAELSIDIDNDRFSVVGIGDMSGDVFGNGMLLSPNLRLIAAFDHRHIFVDPDPDPATSYLERARLFALPRSSWADYDRTAISTGGGVWERASKRIPLNDAIRHALDIPASITALTPPDLIRAILQAPVDLLWNGGIGTYIKAGHERDLDVADKSNDPVRVVADTVRARVIGEGGNLGITPGGRIEFCQNGGKCNTDAVDNSAGVDCSDHEVNIKILLDSAVSAGELAIDERNPLLLAMTADVATAVVGNNIAQNIQLGLSRMSSCARLVTHAQLIADLERHHNLDRVLESLPAEADIARRRSRNQGLTSPELATLTAHTKLAIKSELLTGALIDEPEFESALIGYFPSLIRERFVSAMRRHPLRRDIIATTIVNDLVDNAGLDYAFALAEESGATTEDAVRAFRVVTTLFDLRELWHDIRATPMPTHVAYELELEARRLVECASRWMLADRTRLNHAVDHHSAVRALSDTSAQWMPREAARQVTTRAEELVERGAPRELAARALILPHLFALLDIVEIADAAERPPAEVATDYFTLERHLGVDRLLTTVSALHSPDRWHELTRIAIRDDLYAILRTVTMNVLTESTSVAVADQRVHAWSSERGVRIVRTNEVIEEILSTGNPDVAALSIAARRLRALVRA